MLGGDDLRGVVAGDGAVAVPGERRVLGAAPVGRERAHTDVRTVCVFNPPCTGREVHDENGVYPLLTEEDA